ncbi:MAG: glycosyltransferase family 4 protein [bacterium]
MKIAMIGQKSIPGIYGGIDKHVEELSIRIASKGHEVLVYNRPHYSSVKGQWHGITVKNIPSIPTKSLETITHTFLCSLDVLIQKVDIVHFHGIGQSVFSFIPGLFNKKTVVTLHGLGWQERKWGRISRGLLKVGEYTAPRFPHKTTVVSKLLKEYYKNKHNKEVIWIPNGVETSEPVIINKIKKYGLTKDGYILFVGRLTQDKGCHYLLEAFNQINGELTLVIAGDSSYTDVYTASLKKYQNEKVLFLGQVDKEILAELYSNAYLYVHPSEVEGMSLALLEAMSYGNCVLVSNIPENLEVINGYGYTFGNKDSKDLQGMLRQLLENKKMVNAKKEGAKRHVLTNYSWDKIVNMYEELYCSLLK